MLLKTLRLHHIRSYKDSTISFPESSILLCGDIGSGKTTILLSIEFAIFGLLRGETSGTTLLRHGEREGSVTLTLEVQGKEIVIFRPLKRGTSVKQDAGYLIIDGVKQDLTTVEMKSRILTLIGYPESLLSRSKNMIFRYTVYTPQEEMKKILLESAEVRVDILRKLFDIEKYRIIKENATLLAREKRSETRILQAKVSDLDEKKKQY
ncbi:MAG: SMC family ATPase, partial [Nanoarchaeota archaeon]